MVKKASKVTIKIPRELYKNLQKLIENTGFSSVTEFISFTMRTIASGKTLENEGLTQEEVEKIRKRLKVLGYI